MREIKTVITKEDFMPGDQIEGYVLVTCDKDFDCNAINLRFYGEEKTTVMVHVGKTTVTYTDSTVHVDEVTEFVGSTRVQSGETRYDFKFDMSRDIPGSYQGTHGYIRYTLEAKIEVSWARDPKEKIQLEIKSTPLSVRPESQSRSDDMEEEGLRFFKVEVPTDVVDLGQPFKCRLYVDQEVELRGLRAELVHWEFVQPDRQKRTIKKDLVEWYLEDENLRRNTWIEVELQTDVGWPLSFKTEHIDSSYYLKATLDIARRRDKVIVIPVKVISQPPKGFDDDQEFW